MFLSVIVYDDCENDNEFYKNSCLNKNYLIIFR